MRLQGIGLVEGTPAGELKVGDITRWNFGGIERITSVEFSKTGKTVVVGIEYMSYSEVPTGKIVQSERTFRASRLVNIIGSGNTVLVSDMRFEVKVYEMTVKGQTIVLDEEAPAEEVISHEEKVKADQATIQQAKIDSFKRYHELLQKALIPNNITDEEREEMIMLYEEVKGNMYELANLAFAQSADKEPKKLLFAINDVKFKDNSVWEAQETALQIMKEKGWKTSQLKIYSSIRECFVPFRRIVIPENLGAQS